MANVYVHYCVDSFGVTTLHFSGSQSRPNQSIPNKQHFALAVSAVNQIPAGKRRWDATVKTWMIDSEYWEKVKKFFDNGAPVFELVSYATDALWQSFMSDDAYQNMNRPRTYVKQPDNTAAAGFFNNFNQVIEKVAVTKTDRDTLAELLALPSFDSIPRDRSTAKKLFKVAALKWHPDRNNGDGSKMSTLTQLWREYVEPTL